MKASENERAQPEWKRKRMKGYNHNERAQPE